MWLRAAQAEVLYLPPYSPDFNPIENVFSKTKPGLRTLGLRVVSELWAAIQPVLDRVTARDAAAFFRHCGYATDEK